MICVNLQKRLFYRVNLYNYVAHISFIIAINRRLSLTYSVLLISLFFFRVAVHAMLAIVNFSTNNNIRTSIKFYSVMPAYRILEENFVFLRLLTTCGNFVKKIGTLVWVALEPILFV